MAELIVENGPRAGQRISLTADQPCTIGSGDEATLRVPGAGVASAQCVVKPMKDAGFGLKSRAGETRVNGAPISAVRLADADVIEVPGTRIRYSTNSAAASGGGGPIGQMLGGFRLI